MREKALNAYAKVEPSSSVDSGPRVFGECDKGQDVTAFAEHPATVSFDEASYIWKVPQQEMMDQEYEHLATREPELTPSPDLNAEFKSMVRIVSSSSSQFHSLSTTPDPAANVVPPTNSQGPASSWIPTEDIAPSFDSYGNMYDNGAMYRGAYIPAEMDGDSQWNTLLLGAGTLPGPPHDNFR